jgi:hypothetical protein
MTFVQQKPLPRRPFPLAHNLRISFSDLPPRLLHKPRPDHRIRLCYELSMAVQLELISPRSDPRLDRVKRELSDFASQLDLPLPLSLLGLALGPGFGSLRFQSFAIGLGSHTILLWVSLW